jgi:hypothetical protein
MFHGEKRHKRIRIWAKERGHRINMRRKENGAADGVSTTRMGGKREKDEG